MEIAPWDLCEDLTEDNAGQRLDQARSLAGREDIPGSLRAELEAVMEEIIRAHPKAYDTARPLAEDDKEPG